MTLMAECRPAPGLATEGLGTAVTATLHAVTRLRGEVRLVDAGTLPNDGKVIADERGLP
jgi:phenylacetate-CoA ligase